MSIEEMLAIILEARIEYFLLASDHEIKTSNGKSISSYD